MMPKFYFHIRDGDKWIEDLEGLDLPNADAAKQEALTAAREMLAVRLMAGEVLDGQTLEIWDRHNLVAAIPFKEVVELP
jgi:hypothetical protein